MTQRIREAGHELKYEEYAGREGDIVTGMIQQTDAVTTLLDLGRVERFARPSRCRSNVPTECRIQAYIVEVRKTAKGPQIVVSRTHPGLVKRLFELEVPQHRGDRAATREQATTKIAVWSNGANVDQVDACVGARGACAGRQ